MQSSLVARSLFVVGSTLLVLACNSEEEQVAQTSDPIAIQPDATLSCRKNVHSGIGISAYPTQARQMAIDNAHAQCRASRCGDLPGSVYHCTRTAVTCNPADDAPERRAQSSNPPLVMCSASYRCCPRLAIPDEVNADEDATESP